MKDEVCGLLIVGCSIITSVRMRWSETLKNEARELRRQNLSINNIARSLDVPKSTLHQWIHDLKRPIYITREDKLRHLALIRPLASAALHAKRQNRLQEIKNRVTKEVKLYPIRNKHLLKAMLVMLYWAEGGKGRGTLQFVNTDPDLMLLFITLLRKSFVLDESKLRARLHLHYYHKIKKVRKFWSTLLSISESKFGKIYIKPRSKTKKFRKNFAGICFIKYHNDELRYELLTLAHSLSSKIAGTSTRSSAD